MNCSTQDKHYELYLLLLVVYSSVWWCEEEVFFIQSGSLLFVEYTNNNLYHTLIWSSSILYNKYKLKKNNYFEMYNRKTHRIISTREMTYMQVSTVEYVLYSRTDTDWNRFKTDDKQFYIDRSSFAIPRIFILITFELSNS